MSYSVKNDLAVVIGQHGLRAVLVALSLHCDDSATACRALNIEGADVKKRLSEKLMRLAESVGATPTERRSA